VIGTTVGVAGVRPTAKGRGSGTWSGRCWPPFDLDEDASSSGAPGCSAAPRHRGVWGEAGGSRGAEDGPFQKRSVTPVTFRERFTRKTVFGGGVPPFSPGGVPPPGGGVPEKNPPG